MQLQNEFHLQCFDGSWIIRQEIIISKPQQQGATTGVSNRWTGMLIKESKMEWNNECTQLKITRATGAAHYLVYL